MKILLFFWALLISTISYCQQPKEINNVDSALVILKNAATQQMEMPVDVEITKDYIAQTWQIGHMYARTIIYLTYYKDITKIEIKDGWKIFTTSSKNVVDHIFIKDKVLAEKTLASLMCLIKNSDNKNYELIIDSLALSKKNVLNSFGKSQR